MACVDDSLKGVLRYICLNRGFRYVKAYTSGAPISALLAVMAICSNTVGVVIDDLLIVI